LPGHPTKPQYVLATEGSVGATRFNDLIRECTAKEQEKLADYRARGLIPEDEILNLVALQENLGKRSVKRQRMLLCIGANSYENLCSLHFRSAFNIMVSQYFESNRKQRLQLTAIALTAGRNASRGDINLLRKDPALTLVSELFLKGYLKRQDFSHYLWGEPGWLKDIAKMAEIEADPCASLAAPSDESM